MCLIFWCKFSHKIHTLHNIHTSINNYFLLEAINLEQEKLSTKQDLNLHPLVSGRVPLP